MIMVSESSLEARVLVCDPDNVILPQIVSILHHRFGRGEPPSAEGITAIAQAGTFTHQGIEFTVVHDLKSAQTAVTRAPTVPYFSLVVYESNAVNKPGSAQVISRINQRDGFLPQMIAGRGISAPLAAQCARAGALYFAEHRKEVADQIGKIFKRPQIIPDLTVVKVGGSAFDFDRQIKLREAINLERLCWILANIHEKDHARLIVTVGGGQFGDVIKDNYAKYGIRPRVHANYPKLITEALAMNLAMLKSLFPEDSSMRLDPGAFYYINRRTAERKIPLIATAPHYVLVRDGIPLQDSDTHTIALAEFYGARRVVLVKRTDGIYNYDPYRGRLFSRYWKKDFYVANRGVWRKAQKGNRRHERVTISQMLSGGMSFEGTDIEGRADGSSGHLMEESALQYMLEKCRHVQEILVVHIAPEELHRHLRTTQTEVIYEHEITLQRATISRDRDWPGVLEDNIRAALRGEAKSKIVRE